MAGTKIFGTTDRNQAHRVLEYVLDMADKLDRLDANGADVDYPGLEQFDTQFHPRASCREDPNNEAEPYQVWTDSADPNLYQAQPGADPAAVQSVVDQVMAALRKQLKLPEV